MLIGYRKDISMSKELSHSHLPAELTDQEKELVLLVKKASSLVLGYYNDESFNVSSKKDGSIVTTADLAAHNLLVEGMEKILPGIAVVSEESFEAKCVETLPEVFWLVDPIDGTRGFVNHNDEFSINVARVRGKKTEFGIIAVPTTRRIYLGSAGKGAWVLDDHGKVKSLPCKVSDPACVHVLLSRFSHRMDRDELDRLRIRVTPMGSAIKFGLLAEGGYDVYLRKGQTYEWDTAAGQCILEACGGKVLDLDGNEMEYRKDNLLNSGFVALARKECEWKGVVTDLNRLRENALKKEE